MNHGQGLAATSTSAPAWTDITFDKLKQTMDELKKIAPPAPTPEQKAWARVAGFPGYPGFLVGRNVWDELHRNVKVVSPYSMESLVGVPVALCDRCEPNEWRSAEVEWEAFHKSLADLDLKVMPADLS